MRDKNREEQNYEDMIHLSHPVSKNHSQMSIHDRAAQFSPFAALTGFEGAVKRTAEEVEKSMETNGKD